MIVMWILYIFFISIMKNIYLLHIFQMCMYWKTYTCIFNGNMAGQGPHIRVIWHFLCLTLHLLLSFVYRPNVLFTLYDVKVFKIYDFFFVSTWNNTMQGCAFQVHYESIKNNGVSAWIRFTFNDPQKFIRLLLLYFQCTHKHTLWRRKDFLLKRSM